MRLYLEVARSTFRRTTTYRWATFAGVVTNTVFGFILAYVLLAVVAERGTVGGFDASDAVTFTFVAQGLLMVVGVFGNVEMAERIRTGDVAVDLCRPYDFQSWWLAVHYGKAPFFLLFRGVPTYLLGTLVFDLSMPTDVSTVAAFLASVAVAVGVAGAYGSSYRPARSGSSTSAVPTRWPGSPPSSSPGPSSGSTRHPGRGARLAWVEGVGAWRRPGRSRAQIRTSAGPPCRAALAGGGAHSPVLAGLVSGQLALTHEALDVLGNSKALDHVRHVLYRCPAWPRPRAARPARPECLCCSTPTAVPNRPCVVTDITDSGDALSIRFATTAIDLPDAVAALVRQLVATRRGRATTGAPATTPWLFPSLRPASLWTPTHSRRVSTSSASKPVPLGPPPCSTWRPRSR